jgi:hypothetical protein
MGKVFDEIDERLARRDNAILETIKRVVEPVLAQRSEPKASAAHPTGADDDFSPTADELVNNPAAVFKRFHETKVAPLLAEQPKQDNSGQLALLEAKKLELKGSIAPEAWAKYAPYLDNGLSRVDPRVAVANFDAIWRLAKSYGDDHLAKLEKDQQEQRERRNRFASMEPQARLPEPEKESVKLTDEESAVARSMGLSAEDYRKYSQPTEVEIGSGKRRK